MSYKSKNWKNVGRYFYNKEQLFPVNHQGEEQYLELRRKVLFEKWFPTEDEIVLKSIYCMTCGFMCYSPRPDAQDIETKYYYLMEKESSRGNKQKHSCTFIKLEKQRVRRVYKSISKWIKPIQKKVLDVGGGKLLSPFLQYQNMCYVVDYQKETGDRIIRISSTIQDIPSAMNFDIIICSHVLEHTTYPN